MTSNDENGLLMFVSPFIAHIGETGIFLPDGYLANRKVQLAKKALMGSLTFCMMCSDRYSISDIKRKI